MKTRAIFFASVLLIGCQASGHDANISKQHAQSLSSASHSEKGKSSDRMLPSRWQDDGTNLTQNQDLWHFISDSLKMKVPENAPIREQRNKYLKQKSYLHDVTLRAEPYMYWIVGQIKKRKMPMELVLLPIVESAFNPRATSAANAAGIWQIIPATGRHYGLKQNQWYDGRRDIIASTNVALDILQHLNEVFGGDWLLTIAAYNSGEGRVMKAVKQNKARGKPIDFWHLSLPRETTAYVPKMLALSQILKNNRRYGIRLPTTNHNRALSRVEITQQIELTKVAKMAGIPVDKLKSFNTGYKLGKTAPNGPHYIMVPKSHVPALRHSLAAENIAAIHPIKSTQTRRSITYRIRKGDSIIRIAKQHGVNPKDVMRWNTLLADKKRIYPGDQLMLFVNNHTIPAS